MISGLTPHETQCHNVDDLKAGKYKGFRRLQLVDNLTTFPEAIFSLADSLEVLDLSHNLLSELPTNFHQLHKLKVLFLSFNQFSVFPDVLGKCQNLDMVGFKSNQIASISEHALPTNLRWLILTDNNLSQLPQSFGTLTKLKKLALAGNQLTALPQSIANCTQLELVRLSANKLTTVPEALFTLPKLAWLSLSGNPLVGDHKHNGNIAHYSRQQISLADEIGQGASGVIYRAQLNDCDNPIAVKVFKGGKTSDGYPHDELQTCLSAGQHPNLINTFAHSTSEDFLALLMELIPAGYTNLGLPPSFDTCTRDTFSPGTAFSTQTIWQVANQLADVLAHLHSQHISHGDFYAHNTLINEQNHVMFGDFGAATQLHNLNNVQQQLFEQIEVRAFGNLLDDLLTQSDQTNTCNKKQALKSIRDACLYNAVSTRPNFNDIKQLLAQ